jgi:hypothetical protein
MIECNRTLEQARRDFAQGRLGGVALLRVPMSRHEWSVRLCGRRGDDGMLLDVRTLQPQVFGTLDAAVRALEAIGFRCDQFKLG